MDARPAARRRQRQLPARLERLSTWLRRRLQRALDRHGQTALMMMMMLMMVRALRHRKTALADDSATVPTARRPLGLGRFDPCDLGIDLDPLGLGRWQVVRRVRRFSRRRSGRQLPPARARLPWQRRCVHNKSLRVHGAYILTYLLQALTICNYKNEASNIKL